MSSDASQLPVRPRPQPKLLQKVFEAGADAVMLDLEDAVPPDDKATARNMVREVLADHAAWVRVNSPRSPACAADLDAVADRAAGIRIPKVESVEDVGWVAARAPGTPRICAIETARGVLAAQQIASVAGVRHLSVGGVDLQRDLNAGHDNLHTLYVRSHLVLASRAAGLDPPIDSVYAHIDDDAGLRDQAHFARSLGFFGKSAIHPRQLPILHEAFTPSRHEVEWAQEVLAAFEHAQGQALRLPSGEFVDLPVAQRARRLLDVVAGGTHQRDRRDGPGCSDRHRPVGPHPNGSPSATAPSRPIDFRSSGSNAHIIGFEP